MVIALEVDTRICVGGPGTDLARKTDLLIACMRFLLKECAPKTNDTLCGRRLSFEDFFMPRPYCGSIELITGLRLPGIMRGIQCSSTLLLAMRTVQGICMIKMARKMLATMIFWDYIFDVLRMALAIRFA